MKLIDDLKLKILYPELKDIILTNTNKENILKSKWFRKNYEKTVKEFVIAMKEYSLHDHLDNKKVEMMNNHLSLILKLSDVDAVERYKKYIGSLFYSRKVDNVEVFYDEDFEEILKSIGIHVFNDNIADILKKGYGKRLLSLKQMTGFSLNVSHLNSTLFEDKDWNIISLNNKIGNKKILDIFKDSYDVLTEIIEQDLFDGMKYTYENLPTSHSFFDLINSRKREGFSIEQFSMEFIKQIGDDVLAQLYEKFKFSDKNEFTKIFEIAEVGNYELIQDIVNYDRYNFSFSNISKDQMQKEFIETGLNNFDKKEILVNKYFGIERNDIPYIQLFLTAINQATLPQNFKETYGDVLNLLNKVFISSDEEILKIRRSLKKEKKEEYKKLITSLEQEGNEILKEKFVMDLKKKEQEIKNSALLIKAEDKKGTYKYDIYELSGQPFTMLVHAVTNNTSSCHNDFVKQIIEDPVRWEQISDGNQFLSTSLISNQCMATYGVPNNEKTVLYGFSNFSPDALRYTTVSDAGINRKARKDVDINMRNYLNFASVNTISTIDDVMKETMKRNQDGSSNWNEIGLVRGNIKPDYIVCMDHIYEPSIKAATYFHVPIYLIQRSKYQNFPIKKDNHDHHENSESNHVRR